MSQVNKSGKSSELGNEKGKVVQAEPVGHDPDLLPIKQAKANYIVIAVVVLVGVFFGMGPVLTTISESGRSQRFVEEVSNADLRTMAATGRGLAQISSIPEFRNLAYSRQMAPEFIVAGWFENARVAEQNGLVPRGENLQAIVADFLQQPDASGESTVLAVLQERQGTPEALQMKHVERLLQLVYAGRALEMRYSHTLWSPKPPVQRTLVWGNLFRKLANRLAAIRCRCKQLICVSQKN